MTGEYLVYGANGIIGSHDVYNHEESEIAVTCRGATCGEVTVTKPKSWITGNAMIVKPRTRKLRKDFIFHYFKNHGLKAIISGSAQPQITRTGFAPLVVFFPKPAEQERIAECLSSMDELMAAQARKVDALKTHKRGLMQQLFPSRNENSELRSEAKKIKNIEERSEKISESFSIQNSNFSIPPLRFPEFQNKGEWVESPLSKFILSLDAGVSVNSGDRPAGKNEFGVLKTSAVTNGVFEFDENKVVFAESEQSRLKEPVRGGSIIISRMNTPALVGANAYVESNHENLFLPDRLWAAKPRRDVSMRFLAFILGSDKGRAALSKLAKGSSGSMKNITKPEVLAFSVMAPSPDEQNRIASCLTSLDAMITAETQKHEALKTHKRGLMQQLFPSPEEVEA
jgi:type I restriction enzyme S subunit